jgi:hypothetical protein
MMVSLYYVIQEMHSFSMKPAKYFYDKPLPKYLDPKTVLIYRPHPVSVQIHVQYTEGGLRQIKHHIPNPKSPREDKAKSGIGFRSPLAWVAQGKCLGVYSGVDIR